MAVLDSVLKNLEAGSLGTVTTNVTFEKQGMITLVVGLSVLAVIVALTIVVARKL